MKKILVFFLCIVIFIPLFLCYDRLAYEQAMYVAGLTKNNNVEEVGCHLEVRILERKEDSVLVTTTQDYPYYFDTTGYYDYMFYSTDILEIELKNTEVRCELLAGKVVDIVYVPAAGTTGRNPIRIFSRRRRIKVKRGTAITDMLRNKTWCVTTRLNSWQPTIPIIT